VVEREYYTLSNAEIHRKIMGWILALINGKIPSTEH
jgi:hypothetical protein